MTTKILGVFAAAAAVASSHVHAADNGNPLSLEVSVGGEYDSNIVVPEADLLAAEGDFAAIFGADAQYKIVDGETGELYVGYRFDQTLYAELDAFNMQTHAGTFGGAVTAGKATFDANYSFYHIRLGGDGLLNMHVISPSVSGFLTSKIYARAYYTYFDKSFSTLTERDAKTHYAGATVFHFFPNPKGYVSLGGRVDTEDAVDPALDFDGFELTGNLQLPVTSLNNEARVNFGVGYRDRDYDNITPLIGAARTEERYRARALFETPLSDHVGWQVQYRYTDRNSNFPVADYVEHRVTTEFSYKF